MSSRALGALVLAALLLGLAAFVFFQDFGGASKKGDSKGPVASAPAGGGMAREAASGPSMRTSRRERTAAGRPAAGNPRAPVDEGPVVARGRVILPGGLRFDGLEVVLHTANGEELSTAEPDETGRYELRSDANLFAGWTVASTWIGIHPSSGPFVGKTFSPAFKRIAEAHPAGAPPVECDLVIGEAPKFEGKVIERATGKPIEGATVAAFNGLPAWRDNSLEEATTDADGKYQLSIEDLPCEQLVLCCRADDFQAELVGPIDVAAGATRSQDFSLAAMTPISGRLVDDATGAPIPHATVALCPLDYTLRTDRVQEITDERGEFRLEAPDVAIERSVLRSEAPGYAPALVPGKSCHENMEVRVGKGVSIEGKVRDTAGKVVSGARVDVVLADEWAWDDPTFKDSVRTDGDGTFKLNLEVVPAEGAMVFVDYFPYRVFLAPLATLQAKSSTGSTRIVQVVLDIPTPVETKPASNK